MRDARSLFRVRLRFFRFLPDFGEGPFCSGRSLPPRRIRGRKREPAAG